MKIVKADSKGRVTGFEPGVEYKVGEQSGDLLIRRTDKKTRTELTAWAVQEVFSGQLKEDKGWAEHVECAPGCAEAEPPPDRHCPGSAPSPAGTETNARGG